MAFRRHPKTSIERAKGLVRLGFQLVAGRRMVFLAQPALQQAEGVVPKGVDFDGLARFVNHPKMLIRQVDQHAEHIVLDQRPGLVGHE
jgi:hypothetical protein